jgi:hypothetical protein
MDVEQLSSRPIIPTGALKAQAIYEFAIFAQLGAGVGGRFRLAARAGGRRTTDTDLAALLGLPTERDLWRLCLCLALTTLEEWDRLAAEFTRQITPAARATLIEVLALAPGAPLLGVAFARNGTLEPTKSSQNLMFGLLHSEASAQFYAVLSLY